MSTAELAKVEEHVRKIIAANVSVYAKESSLAVAKQINGLRAVFGEVYPDPVRIVSVGVPVDDLLSTPGNAAWMDAYSGEPYHAAVGNALATLDRLGAARGAEARYDDLLATFIAATKLEAAFWDMGLAAG